MASLSKFVINTIQCKRVTGAYSYKMAYKFFEARSDPKEPVPVVCVHGLTRNANDFDAVAERLVEEGRNVYSVDVVGRARSDYLADGDESGYAYDQYCADLLEFVTFVAEKHGSRQVDWFGTSMGGLIGMTLLATSLHPTAVSAHNASLAEGSRVRPSIRKYILNDIGPFVPSAGLQRLLAYVNLPKSAYKSIDDVEKLIRTLYRPFGDLSDSEWHKLALSSAIWVPRDVSVLPDSPSGLSAWGSDRNNRFFLADNAHLLEGEGGEIRLHYDQRLATNLKPSDIDLFAALWDRIPAQAEGGPQVYLLKGAESDLLLDETVEEMKRRGPSLRRAVSFPSVGHAPALFCPLQLDAVSSFLRD